VIEKERLALDSIFVLAKLDFSLNLKKWARKELANPPRLLPYVRNLWRIPHLLKNRRWQRCLSLDSSS